LGEYLKKLAGSSDWDTFKEIATKQIKTILDNMIDEILLYQQAKREGGDKMKEGLDKAAISEWRKYVVEHGGNEAAAEEALRKEEKIDRKEFNDRNKRMILVSYLVSLRFSKDQPVSHREVVETYHRLKEREFAIKPRLTFRLIDIQPARLQLTDLTVDRHTQALELADELMAKLIAGEDFGELARQYSHDPMAGSGGLWRSIDPQSLAEPYDALAAKIAALPIGLVEGPLDIKGHVFIVRLEDSQEQGYQPLEEVQAKIEAKIRRDRYTQAQEKLETELAERSKVGQTEAFVEGCVAEIYRRSQPTP
jgi:parvulin-like peptidyl-prolyl isomerase